MSSRDTILTRLREVQPPGRPLPPVPMYDTNLPPPVDAFRKSLDRLGGIWCEPPADGDLDAFIARRFPKALVVCTAVPEVEGTRHIADVRRPQDLDDVDVGVVRAVFGVAETGSVLLTETDFRINALGFLSQHLVVLLDPKDIVPNLHHAYRHRGFFDARYAVFMTGPSATADIEGVLIRGAQGIRSLTVIPRSRPRPAS